MVKWRRALRRRVGDDDLVKQLMDLNIVAARISGPKAFPALTWPDEKITTDLVTERFFLDAAHHVRSLNSVGAIWRRGGDGQLVLDIAGVSIAPTSAEELLIAEEIFVQGIYHFTFHSPVVILDIGANVLIASLAFAANNHVVKVYAFEPLQENVERAQTNLGLNPQFSEKVVLNACGLGESNRTIDIEFDPQHRGSTSMLARPQKIQRLQGARALRPKSATIRIAAASEAVAAVRRSHPGLPIWAKIDCEGAEDEILPALISSDQIRELTGIVMETHFGNGARHEASLADAGFSVWRPEPNSADLGYILAVRT